MTTNVISGQLQDENSGKYHYYTFMAGPGEITLTLSLESYPQASSNGIGFTLFDYNERMLGFGMTMSIPGRPTQTVTKIDIPSKQSMLLRIEEKVNFGLGKYRLQLEGAFETETEQKRPSNSSDLPLSSQAVSKDKRRAAETIFTQPESLLRQADDLMDKRKTGEAQEKYREAIGIFSAIIQLELDVLYRIDEQNKKKAITKSPSAKSIPKDPLIEATRSAIPEESKARALHGLSRSYRGRAIAKSKLGDKAGACEDYRMSCVLISDSSCEETKKFCN